MTPEELLAWRKARGFNQGDVADHLGVSRQTVIRWERGRFALPDDLQLRLERGAQPHDVSQRRRSDGRITQMEYESLFDRVQGSLDRFLPGPLHPCSLAELGLLGWPGATWRNMRAGWWSPNNLGGFKRPHRAILQTDEYVDAVNDMLNGIRHPAITEHLRLRSLGGNPPDWVVQRSEAFEPWDGLHFWADMPPTEE